MTIHGGRANQVQSLAAKRRSAGAAGLGNALEWFDWTLYGTFSVYIGTNFFEKSNPTSALLATMAVFAVGFVARPFGGFIFGRLGDKIGRKNAMVTSMLILAGSSFALAILPTYEQVGFWASVLLLVARLVQGVAHGGEVGVSYTYVAEIAPKEKRGLWSSSVYVAVTVGVMAATAIAAALTGILSKTDMVDWGWRIGFALGGLLGVFALWMRRKAIETEAFVAEKATEAEVPTETPHVKLSRRQITLIALRIVTMSVGINVGYYTWVTFMPSVAISQHGMDATSAFVMSLIAQAITLLLLPLFGQLSDRFGRKPMALAHGVSIVLFAFPIAAILGGAPWTLFVAQMLGLIAWALMGAQYPAVVAEQAPTRVRALTVGVVTSLSVAIFGGSGPYLNTWLQSIGQGWVFNAYMVFLGVVCIIGSFLIRETKGIDLTSLEQDTVDDTASGNKPAKGQIAVS